MALDVTTLSKDKKKAADQALQENFVRKPDVRMKRQCKTFRKFLVESLRYMLPRIECVFLCTITWVWNNF